ncbi:hypothetical protein PWY87_22505 [Kribbella solani]|nr:hypothetical protein [Kribbella solani]MDX2974222.1 hypothetical protein [Kribbella solani]MDX3004478.1 hypothetical protein [Kribbella solani]
MSASVRDPRPGRIFTGGAITAPRIVTGYRTWPYGPARLVGGTPGNA